jgi:hypothetical protein
MLRTVKYKGEMVEVSVRVIKEMFLTQEIETP